MEEKFTNEEKEVIKKMLERNKNPKLLMGHINNILEGEKQSKWENEVYFRYQMWRIGEMELNKEITNKLYSNTNNLN